MQERNLDLDLPLRREQWNQIGERAAALEQDDGQFEWAADRERITVYLSNDEARGLWRDLASEPQTYGGAQVEIAEFVFNDGRPYADLKVPPTWKPPAILPQEEAALDAQLERIVREKWHRLLEESGLHFEFGHVSPEVE